MKHESYSFEGSFDVVFTTSLIGILTTFEFLP